MKAITIKQPWASLIVHGIKDIENRTWRTNFRGRVLIHASADNRLMNIPPSEFMTGDQCVAIDKVRFPNKNWRLYSAIIGSVEIVDCVQNHPSIWAEQTEVIPLGNVLDDLKLLGRTVPPKPIYNWVLANPILYEKPIENVKGKLSFWDYPGIEEVKIECPYCGSIELAMENHTTKPFSTYLHSCKNCGHVIMESEWERVKE